MQQEDISLIFYDLEKAYDCTKKITMASLGKGECKPISYTNN
jgi:hypothetical protein